MLHLERFGSRSRRRDQSKTNSDYMQVWDVASDVADKQQKIFHKLSKKVVVLLPEMDEESAMLLKSVISVLFFL